MTEKEEMIHGVLYDALHNLIDAEHMTLPDHRLEYMRQARKRVQEAIDMLTGDDDE